MSRQKRTPLRVTGIAHCGYSHDPDCAIGDRVRIASGAYPTGELVAGANALIFTGAVLLPRVRISRDAIVGTGAVKTHDVEPDITVASNPVEPIAH